MFSSARRLRVTYGGRRRSSTTKGKGQPTNPESHEASQDEDDAIAVSRLRSATGSPKGKGKAKASNPDQDFDLEEVVVTAPPRRKIGTTRATPTARKQEGPFPGALAPPASSQGAPTVEDHEDSPVTDYDEDVVLKRKTVEKRPKRGVKASRKVSGGKGAKDANGSSPDRPTSNGKPKAKARRRPPPLPLSKSPSRSKEDPTNRHEPSPARLHSPSTSRPGSPKSPSFSSSRQRLNPETPVALNAPFKLSEKREGPFTQAPNRVDPTSVPPSARPTASSPASPDPQKPPATPRAKTATPRASLTPKVVSPKPPATPTNRLATSRSATPKAATAASLAPPRDLADIFSAVTGPIPSASELKTDGPRVSKVAQMSARSQAQSGSLLQSPSFSSRDHSGISTPRKINASVHELGTSPSIPSIGGSLSRSPSRSLLGSPQRSLSRVGSGSVIESGMPIAPMISMEMAALSAATAAQGRGKTYGGSKRSFLPDEDPFAIEEATGGTDDLEDTQEETQEGRARPAKRSKLNLPLSLKPRESYADLRRKWGIDEDEGEDLSGLSQPDLRTLAHQRTVGSSKRFTDELSYLFEGLSSREDLSSRRSSAVQLVGNLLEDEFARKLKAHGLLEKVYEKLRAAGGGGSEGDRVLDTALVFYVATLSVDQRMAEPVLRIPPRRDDAVEDKTGGSEDPLSVDSDCLRVMARILRSPTTKVMVGAAVKGNKSEKLKLEELAKIIHRSSLKQHLGEMISLANLVLFALASISTFSIRPGLQPQQALVQSGAMRDVVDYLAEALGGLSSRLEGFSRGLDLLPSGSKILLQSMDFCISIIETCTTCDSDSLLSLLPLADSLGPGFVSLIPVCVITASGDDKPAATLALDILIGSLRSLINVTNVSADWLQELCVERVVEWLCKILDICRVKGSAIAPTSAASAARMSSPMGLDKSEDGSSAPPPSQDQSATLAFDLLCVTLALLVNLVEQGGSGKRLLLDTVISEHCSPLKRKCALDCRCSDASSAFQSVVRLYADPLAFCPSQEEKDFVRTYGGILVTLATIEDVAAQDTFVAETRRAGGTIDALLGSVADLAKQNEAEAEQEGIPAASVKENVQALRRLLEALEAKWLASA